MRSTDMATMNAPASTLNTETSMALSQSMDSVNATPEEEVRTLFVSGLPMDAKPRELYLLFRAYKGFENGLLKSMGKLVPKHNCGYEGSLLKITNKNGKNTSPVGFVTFSSRCAAESAKQDLQGVRFDPDLPQTLRLEFAKSNTKVTKPKQQSPQPAAPTTIIHPLTGQELGTAIMPAGGPETWAAAAHPALAPYPELTPTAATTLHPTTLLQHPALTQLPVRITYRGMDQTMVTDDPYRMLQPATILAPPVSVTAVGHPPLVPTPIMAGSPVGGLTSSSAAAAAAAAAAVGVSPYSTPCSTLFVANLGQFSSEQELKDLFSSFHGFCRLRMHNKGGSPVAFVEFQDVRQATEAMSRLQGFVLLSSDRGGIRIEYAKNKMGEVGAKLEFPLIQSPVSMATVF
ncbi:uncharacterized protein LOC143277898 [Babylonia areolata]|uniref:uncharacterized protein LOC143277898 n=1 Tax=Babylonia areolata TaxID=304850 RepID=UPI003FD25712